MNHTIPYHDTDQDVVRGVGVRNADVKPKSLQKVSELSGEAVFVVVPRPEATNCPATGANFC